jgi:hypothetical protein
MVPIFHLPDLKGDDESLAGKAYLSDLVRLKGGFGKFLREPLRLRAKVCLMDTQQDFDALELNFICPILVVAPLIEDPLRRQPRYQARTTPL